MGIFSKFFKSSDDDFSTKNSAIRSAHEILQDGSLQDEERFRALGKLKNIFLTSTDKVDVKAISVSILKAATIDVSVKIQESALKTIDSIIDNCLFVYKNSPNSPQYADSRLKLSIVSEYAVPLLMETRYKSGGAGELKLIAFVILSKIAPFAVNDERILFFARKLNDPSDNIKMAVISTFENLVASSDKDLKRRIARVSVTALCQALNDSALRPGATRVLGGLGTFALAAVPFLYNRLDGADGESAAGALRSITGEQYSKDDKKKWEEWLQKNVVEKT